MLYSSILPVLCAAGALAGPVINHRNLPNGVAGHQHNHMDFHAHRARDDTPADKMMAELESLPGAQGNLPADNSGSPPPAQPSAQSNVVYVTAPPSVTTTTIQAGAQAPPSPAAPPPAKNVVVNNAAPNNDNSNPAVKMKISGPPVQQQGAPQVQQPAASSSQSSQPTGSPSSGNGMPSAPTTFDASMTADDQAYKDLVLVHHNIHRANHSLPALEWNDTLYEFAKQSAQSCIYEHTNPVPPYGQNIAAGNAPGNVSADITNGFYNGEIGLFQQAIGEFGNNSPDMSDFEHWGHATQMLWKETTSVACYTASCTPPGGNPQQCGSDGMNVYLQKAACDVRAFNLVCDYYPPGKFSSHCSVP